MSHQPSNLLFRRHNAFTLALLLLSSLFVAPIAHGKPLVISNFRVPFEDKVYFNHPSQPEWVTVTGFAHVVSKVTIPGEPCIPGDPCKNLNVAIHINLANTTAIGQTTGLSYRATGATNFTVTTDVPGNLTVQKSYRLSRLKSTVRIAQPLTVSMTMTEQGKATAATVLPSLVSWWPAEGNAIDAAGSNPGTLVGGVTFVPGKVGQAFHFDGASLVEAPASPSLEPQTLTTMLWMRSATPQPATYLLSKGAYACNADSSYAFYTAGELNFYISDGLPGNFSPSPSATGLFDGNWHHLAGTYDGGAVRLYVDGVEQETGNPAAIASLNYTMPDNQIFRIGGYASSCVNFLFDGDIDEVQLFNRALSAEEIGAFYGSIP